MKDKVIECKLVAERCKDEFFFKKISAFNSRSVEQSKRKMFVWGKWGTMYEIRMHLETIRKMEERKIVVGLGFPLTLNLNNDIWPDVD